MPGLLAVDNALLRRRRDSDSAAGHSSRAWYAAPLIHRDRFATHSLSQSQYLRRTIHDCDRRGVPVLVPTLRLREHRERLGLTQSELADRLVQVAWARERIRVGVNSDMVSKWERGIKQPSKLYQRLLSLALDASPQALGLLLASVDLGAEPSRGRIPPGLLPATAPQFATGAVNPHVLMHVDALFASLAAVDNAIGARLVLGAAEHEATLLEQLSVYTRGGPQGRLHRAAARFNELTGWLHQDLGDLERARHYSERAMDLAVVHGDPELVTYMLMRRSNVAAERGAASEARSFADAAVSEQRSKPPTLAAVSLRASAIAHSLMGDAATCARALGEAREALDGSEQPADDNLAPYCTPAYLAMEAGACWLTLSRPQKAAAALENALAIWPAGQDRDRSLAMSRLAIAYAELGDVDRACAIAEPARELVLVTGSTRALASLTSLETRLAPHSKRERVAELRRNLAAL